MFVIGVVIVILVAVLAGLSSSGTPGSYLDAVYYLRSVLKKDGYVEITRNHYESVACDFADGRKSTFEDFIFDVIHGPLDNDPKIYVDRKNTAQGVVLKLRK